ncbi:hypothetical protein AAG570_008183 [Ranatra chinensis]|uniref:RRM domain-containing protein n=1 Tax=Ranatra chinensis TaxID=642074 RepID=A0ABD0XSE6_9HEMI
MKVWIYDAPLQDSDPANTSLVFEFLDSPLLLSLPPPPFTPSDVSFRISRLPEHKSPGYDLATEDDVIQLFSTYGNVQEVVLLRRQQKLVGCCFVQFQNKASAAKAIAKTSGKPFLGRQIIVDWAVSKKKYGSSGENKETKLEPVENIIKEEIVDQELSQDDTSVKSEGKSLANKRIKTKQKCYNGVSDERTLFIRNLPFSASNDDFRKCVETFGNVCYSLICVNPVSQLSNGTAFVRFEDIKSATACLNAGNALKLDGVVLQPHLALPKDQLPKKEEHKIKDNRNLYLAKEGVIIAGTPAASGVSASDMSKRLSLELWKSQSLRNSCEPLQAPGSVGQSFTARLHTARHHDSTKRDLAPDPVPLVPLAP